MLIPRPQGYSRSQLLTLLGGAAAVLSGYACGTQRRPDASAKPIAEQFDIAYHASGTVTERASRAVLTLEVSAQNIGTRTVHIDVGSWCRQPPRLHLLRVSDGQTASWDEVLWRQQQSARDAEWCAEPDIVLILGPNSQTLAGRREYDIFLVRGDSLPAGQYDIWIEMSVTQREERREVQRADHRTMKLPMGRVWLP